MSDGQFPTCLVAVVKDSAREVYKELGSGHSEAVYETALELELRLRDVVGPIMRQVPCPIRYKGRTVGTGYIDLLVDDVLVVELKAVAKVSGRDETQVMKYLAGSGLKAGLLVNFNQVSGEVEVADIARVGDRPHEPGGKSGTSPVQVVATTTATNVVGYVSSSTFTWQPTDPPDPSLVGATPSPLPPTLSGGQSLDLPHESSELIEERGL